MQRKPKGSEGFTLVEMIVVIAIIGTLASILLVNLTGHTDEAKVAAAKSQVGQLESAIISFQAHVGRLPETLSELVERPANAPGWKEGGYLRKKGVPKDPWGNDFVYRTAGKRFLVLSLGADGQEGGAGVDGDISNESVDSGK